MKLNELMAAIETELSRQVECVDCLEVGQPTEHGSCSTCGSKAVMWVVGELVTESEYVEPIPEAVLCGCDKKYLREMGVSA